MPVLLLQLNVQARNIAITVRTIIVGLTYLATFIFSANAVGLTGGGACYKSTRHSMGLTLAGVPVP